MILRSSFDKRVVDIKIYYRLLRFIVNIESHKNIPLVNEVNGNSLYVEQQMQCCLKAQALVLLYNLVESTICECLNAIYDAVHDDKLTYNKLTDEMRRAWTKSCKRAKMPEKDWSEEEKMNHIVKFKELATNISGSMDIRNIYNVFSQHGCTINNCRREDYAKSFLIVKSKRNLLAHGNISFSECGTTYVLSDLEKMKQDIITFLEKVIESTHIFISDKKYLR